MTFDRRALVSGQQKSAIEKVIKLDSEAENAKGKDKKEKKAQAESLRNELLKSDSHLCYHMLKVLNKDSANNLRSTWAINNKSIGIPNPIWSGWNNINIPTFNLSILPRYSFAIQFTFELAKPYISRDEQEFYIIDNPIRKDKVSGLPYIAPSSWKGNLRSALWQSGYKEEIRRPFGNERSVEEESKFQKGRLHFYSTFFTEKSLEVINPHDREKRVGRLPIYFESVRIDAKGIFSLLYTPFDRVGKDKRETQRQTASDLKLICEGIQAMFTVYGFGAKTSSGFGVAKSELEDGKITLNAEGIEVGEREEVKPQQPERSFAKYLKEDGSVKEKFKGTRTAGLLSDKEYGEKRQQLEGISSSEFKKFRRWYNQYGEQWQKYIQSQKTPAPIVPMWTFVNFDELLKRAEEIRIKLMQEEVESQ